MKASGALPNPTRRGVLSGLCALGAATSPASRVHAQSAPVTLNFWMFENPQQRPWVHKRINQYMAENPNVKVNFQSFAFNDLGKKLSVGFATGTAPDGFLTGEWLMPTWIAKKVLAPLDVRRLGYSSLDSYVADFPPAFAEGSVVDKTVYGFPFSYYSIVLHLNTKQFQEVGLDPAKDVPRTWDELGEVAKRLTVKDGGRFVRQGFKFAMHAPIWTVAQFNPILRQCGGAWFDETGRSTVNSAAAVKAMTIRAMFTKKYGVDDPSDSLATAPEPWMDWVRERCSIFQCPALPLSAIGRQNPEMRDKRYFRIALDPGVEAGKGYATTYGFNFVVHAKTPPEKQAVLEDMYRFILDDPVDYWKDVGPFPLARKSNFGDLAAVREFPQIDVVLTARDAGAPYPRTIIFNELADSMHRTVQKIMLSDADIQAALNEAAAEIDRATQSARG